MSAQLDEGVSMANQYPPGPGYPYGGNPYGGMPPNVPYPQQPYGFQPGYGAPVFSPPGGTAITAAVLSILGALSTFIGACVAWYAVSELTSMSEQRYGGGDSPLSGWIGVTTVVAVGDTVVAVVLLVGGVLLLRRSLAGRMTVIVGCAAVIVICVISFLAVLAMTGALHAKLGSEYSSAMGTMMGMSAVRTLGPILFAGATMVLALLKQTKEWCEYKPPPVGMVGPGGYPGPVGPAGPGGYPGYPPQY
jgi:hypothetical protein